MSYIDVLIANCEAAKKAEPQSEFVLANVNELVNDSHAVYIIEELDGDSERTFLDFTRFKKEKTHACARLNAPSRILYVGSSTTGLRNRIKQHLGEGYAGTYSLHLSSWFKGKYEITIKTYDVPIEVLQIVEDDLAHRLAPAFGKTGGNNK